MFLKDTVLLGEEIIARGAASWLLTLYPLMMEKRMKMLMIVSISSELHDSSI